MCADAPAQVRPLSVRGLPQWSGWVLSAHPSLKADVLDRKEKCLRV